MSSAGLQGLRVVLVAGNDPIPVKCIWLTPARDDRVSFGCGAEFQYTYFDECVLGAWPKSRTWAQLFDRTNPCVRLKESELSQASSMPQAFFGKAVKDLALP